MSRAVLVGPWRVALRIARRSALRHRGRSALILLMLLIPAYAGTVLTASWSNLSGTSAQETTFTLGSADLIIDAASLPEIEAALPSGSVTTGLTQARTVVRTPDGLRTSQYEAADPNNALHHGRYVLRAGRAPDGPSEVAVTRAMADELGVRAGSRITAGMPQRDLTVVGVIDWSRSLRASGLLVPRDFPLSAARSKLMVQLPNDDEWLPPRTDVGSATMSVLSRTDMAPTAGERQMEAATAVLVVSFAGAQLVLLVGAAFLVGAARQRRELAVVAAAGATRRQVRLVVLAGGLLLGALAAAAGVILGLSTFAAAGPLIERIADHPLIDVSMPAWQLVGVVGVTVAIAVLATLLPARAIRQRFVRGALGGQRDQSRLDAAGAVAAVGLIGVGTLALVVSGTPQGRSMVLAAGGIALLLGVVACTPALVQATGRLAGELPMPARLAVRHAVRHRLRTSAAMGAVIAAVAGSVALALAGAARGEAAPTRVEARPGQVLMPVEAAEVLGPVGLNRMTAALPTRAAVTLRTATNLHANIAYQNLPGSPTDPSAMVGAEQRDIAVGTADIVQVVTGRGATDAERVALEHGDAVAFNDTLVATGNVVLSAVGQAPTSVPAVVATRGEYFTKLPGLLISPETAQRLGVDAQPRLIVVDTTRTPTQAELAEANEVLLRAQLTAAKPAPSPLIIETAAATGQSSRQVTTMFYVLAAVSALVTIVASTVAVGLAAVELRPDMATMAAVGATPRIRRSITVTQALVIAGVGAVLGLIAGIGPAAAYVSYSTELRWHVPWTALLIIVLVPPALAMAVAVRLARGKLPLVRRAS
ncbi:FtsX-like permease family protein [Micromonospora chokoriensis]|uniref:Putative ABC transport system permease protein n=1 Tax=Micromonospora chokoriensis TaxID=356851 RepID=A0A1C4Y7K0_9ACTN|nr:ABC transporter permease [Micromonospora chokoriensis]SCF16694.1 putative ABC transport system permease protein [Micromonospora chokoriensis]